MLLSFGTLAAVLAIIVNAVSVSFSTETIYDMTPLPGPHPSLQIPSPAKVTKVTSKSLSSRSLNKRVDEEVLFGSIQTNSAITNSVCGVAPSQGLVGPENCIAAAVNSALQNIFDVGFLPEGQIDVSTTQDIDSTNWILTTYWTDPNLNAWDSFDTINILSFAIDAAAVFYNNTIQLGCLNGVNLSVGGVAWVAVLFFDFTSGEELLTAVEIEEFINQCSILV